MNLLYVAFFSLVSHGFINLASAREKSYIFHLLKNYYVDIKRQRLLQHFALN